MEKQKKVTGDSSVISSWSWGFKGLLLIILPLVLIASVQFNTPMSLEVRSLLAGKIKIGTDFVMFIDGAVYRGMVDSSIPLNFQRHRPWGMRVLGPFVVSLLPMAPATGFFVLQWVCNYLNIILSTLILAKFGLKIPSLIFTQVLFAGIFWNIKWSFFMPTYLESFTLMFILLLFFLAASSSFVIILPIFVLSTLAKESTILLAPVLATFKGDRSLKQLMDRRSLLFFALLIAIWAIIIGVLDKSLPEISSKYSPEYLVRQVVVTYITEPDRAIGLLLSFFSGLGILPLFLIVNGKLCLRELRKDLMWRVFIVTGMVPLLCGWDTARYFQMLLLPSLFLAAHVFQNFWDMVLQQPKLRPVFVVWVLCLLFSHYYLGEIFYPITQTDEFFSLMMPMVATSRMRFLRKLGFSVLIFGLGTLLKFQFDRRELSANRYLRKK